MNNSYDFIELNKIITNQTNPFEAINGGAEEERELRPRGDGKAGWYRWHILHGNRHGEHDTEEDQVSGDDGEWHQEL